ncbi:MAG: AMP-binding protein, partial [Actinobacteria bacterium]|nr:AMP-binding protein [Actinomycetota bacterium]
MNLTETPIVVPPAPNDNITDLLEQRVAATPDRVLFATQRGDEWSDLNAREFRDLVVSVAKGLVASGVEPGDRIAFICKTSFEWTLVDFALHYAGAIMVPVYETSSALQVHWILEDSGARGVITETADHAGRVAEVRS